MQYYNRLSDYNNPKNQPLEIDTACPRPGEIDTRLDPRHLDRALTLSLFEIASRLLFSSVEKLIYSLRACIFLFSVNAQNAGNCKDGIITIRLYGIPTAVLGVKG
jgi:hypothetical protein